MLLPAGAYNSNKCSDWWRLVRFEVKYSDAGNGARSYGVWDTVDERWKSSEILPSAEAESFAAKLNIEYNTDGLRPRSEVRRIHPAKRVEVKVIQWREGDLDCWVKESDGWYGHAHIDGWERADWYPADRLRPTTL